MTVRPDDMPGEGRPGSLHDPNAVLAPAMWERPMRQTPVACRMCAAAAPARSSMLLEVPRAWAPPFPVEQAQRLQNERGPLALVCSHCDRVSAPAKVG